MSDIMIYIVVIIILFVLVILNNRRNQTKIKKRRRRSFRDIYLDKKKESKDRNEDLHENRG